MRILLILFILISANGLTQEISLNSSEKESQLRTFLTRIKEDRVLALANYTVYPLKRQKPLPNIKDQGDFILAYPMLFDDHIKSELLGIDRFDDSNVIISRGAIGLLNGNIWLNEEGLLKSLNYSSEQEQEHVTDLNNEMKAVIHSSVKNWEEIEVLKRSEKFIIKIDRLEDGSLRYVSWNLPKSMDTEPSLVLSEGELEHHGTGGGHAYVFTNGIWRYSIEYVVFCESAEDCGYFLKLYKSDELIQQHELSELL